MSAIARKNPGRARQGFVGSAVEKSPKKFRLATGADFGIVTVGSDWGLYSSRMRWSADRGQRPQHQQKAEGYPDEFPQTKKDVPIRVHAPTVLPSRA